MDDDNRPDNVEPTPPAPPVNAREVERLAMVRKIQAQTNEAAIERIRKFGPPRPQPQSQAQRLNDRATLARNIRLGIPSITQPINNGGNR